MWKHESIKGIHGKSQSQDGEMGFAVIFSLGGEEQLCLEVQAGKDLYSRKCFHITGSSNSGFEQIPI